MNAPMDDREIARRSYLRSRLTVTVKVRWPQPHAPSRHEVLDRKRFVRATMFHYAGTLALLVILAAGVAAAVVELNK